MRDSLWLPRSRRSGQGKMPWLCRSSKDSLWACINHWGVAGWRVCMGEWGVQGWVEVVVVVGEWVGG